MLPIYQNIIRHVLIQCNSTVWIYHIRVDYAGCHQFLHSSGLNETAITQHQVISCVKWGNVYQYNINANHCHRLKEIWPIVEVKNKTFLFREGHSFMVNMFDRARIIFSVLEQGWWSKIYEFTRASLYQICKPAFTFSHHLYNGYVRSHRIAFSRLIIR